MDVDRRLRENRALRARLDALLTDGRRNEQIFDRHRKIEVGLMEGSTFPELFDMLFNEFRRINDYDAVTLALCDPDHDLRRLFKSIEIEVDDHPDLILLDGFSELFRALAWAGSPSLGAFVKPIHNVLFPFETTRPQSVAIVPLKRRGILIGSVNLGSRDLARFASGMATDFVERLAGIIAICFENVANHERLKHVSLTDPLTGVHNRRYFDQRLREEADRARRSRRPISCLFVDIDRFKSINDRYGHPVGDEVLRGVAARIKGELRLSDTLGRYGGEEFAAVLADTDASTAMTIAERVRAGIEGAPFDDTKGADIPVTVSVGTATALPEHFDNAAALATQLVGRADHALYRAKQEGRNCVRAAE
ncbi:MAG: sensor domain-containing diguanylate cyclase [Proteobacteria bacterium]|nr:sensor domain-containing diguanylate cyclase [Burkholderiales bacterium]